VSAYATSTVFVRWQKALTEMPQGKETIEMENVMTNVNLYRQKLVARKQELSERLEQLEDVLDDPKSQDFSEHAVESEFDEVYESQGRAGLKEMAAIDAALERVEKGEFGICASCGNTISKERLDAVPYAALCRNCMS